MTNVAKAITINGVEISISDMIEAWQGRYEHVYPMVAGTDSRLAEIDSSFEGNSLAQESVAARDSSARRSSSAQPQVFLPVFPGTNCEYDSARAFERAGADAVIDVFANRNEADIQASIERMARHIDESQILMLSGGFSAGDEPDGSGKFIASVLLNEQIRDSVERLLARDGLILGICNGFQALIKVGLLPYGEFGRVNPTSPTLVKNDLNRHVSRIVQTRTASNQSPWLAGARLGELHNVAISHGEGKFVADDAMLHDLVAHGQVATQYVDLAGNPTMNSLFNPNGSTAAIEGITSPDGRIFGKMGHSERWGANLYKNVVGNYDQKIFKSGVDYVTAAH